MSALRRLAAILLADLRERTRSRRFWLLLAVLTGASWWCFPSADKHYLTVAFGATRGYYSSAWIGLVLALQFGTLLSLFGFYVIRGTLARDIETRVWQLLVATPMTRVGYLFGKWLSHMAVFALLLGAGLLLGLVAQQVRGEVRGIDLFELVKPMLLLSVPALALTAAFAVWFDLLPWLRRTAGNVVFFFVWATLFSGSMARLDPAAAGADPRAWASDPQGLVIVAREVERRVADGAAPEQRGLSVGVRVLPQAPNRFDWPAWSPPWPAIGGRLLWLFGALLLVAAATPLLDWAAARGPARRAAAAGAGRRLAVLDRLLAPFERGPLGLLVTAELKLVLRGRRLLWWGLLLLALVLQAVVQGQGLLLGLLLAWLLSLDVHARAVLRERDCGTSALVWTAAGIRRRLLVARVVTGLLLALLPTLPGLLRAATLSPGAGLAVLAIGVSIALLGPACAVLWRSPRPFELALVLAAYLSVQGAPLLDPLQPGNAVLAGHALAIAAALLLLPLGWRRLTAPG